MTFDRFNSIQERLAMCVAGKYHLDQATAKDFASHGLEYSFRYFLANNRDLNEKELFGLAYRKDYDGIV